MLCAALSQFSRVWPFVTAWTVAHQAPLFMGFFRQENWSGLPFPSSGDLPNPGIESVSLEFPALEGGLFTTSATWEALQCYILIQIIMFPWGVEFFDYFIINFLKLIFLWISRVCLRAQLRPILCNPMQCCRPGSCVHGIFQARIQEWVVFFSLGDLLDPGIEPTTPMSPALKVASLLPSHSSCLPAKGNPNKYTFVLIQHLINIYKDYCF